MSSRPTLAADPRLQREALFHCSYDRIVVLSEEMLRAHAVAENDAELTVAEISIDAALGALTDFDQLRVDHPARQSVEEAVEFLLVRAAVAADAEIRLALGERQLITAGSIIQIGGAPTGLAAIHGFRIFDPAF